MVNLNNLIKQYSYKCHRDQDLDAKQRIASYFLKYHMWNGRYYRVLIEKIGPLQQCLPLSRTTEKIIW